MKLPIAQNPAGNVNENCALVTQLGRPVYDSCEHCTQKLGQCLQFRGAWFTALGLPLVLVAVFGDLPLWGRVLTTGAAVGMLLRFLMHVAKESQRTILLQAQLRIQSGCVQDEVRARTEELAEQKHQLSVTLSAISEAIISVNIDRRITFLNPAAEKMTGWGQGSALGKRVDKVLYLFAPGQRNKKAPIESRIAGVLEGHAPKATQRGSVRSHTGLTRSVDYHEVPLRDHGGGLVGVVLVLRDITEELRLEEDRVRASKLDSLGILAGGIAHDFNNFLMSMQGNISLAWMRHQGDAETEELLAAAETAAKRARGLTRQLLTFSKGGEPVRRAASLAKLVRESSGFALSGSNVRCELQIEDDLPAVSIDEGQMTQVLNNLLINADQAMPHGGVVTVHVRRKNIGADSELPLAAGSFVHMSIADNGAGIPKKHLAQIFDPYFTTKQSGSGLGLATSYSIAQKHDGLLTVESPDGEGATFHVYIPALQQRRKTTIETIRVIEQGQGRILIMDDEESVRNVAARMLKRLGFDVEVAKDGAEAIQLYEHAKNGKRFDAVIMDMTVPGGMGGREAMLQLVRFDPDVLGIASSGYCNDPVMANYDEHGFSAVLAKPYNVQELQEALKGILTQPDALPESKSA